MAVLVAAVLAVSIWTVHRAGREALRDFRAGQARLAQDTAEALGGYLESFDRDTRLLATLARGTRSQNLDARAQDKAILNAFLALATVVPHYRTIGLFQAGRRPIVAVDPTEDPVAIAPALVIASEELAPRAAEPGKAARSGPVTLGGGRSFYLYAVGVGGGEAVVVTSDAALMLEAVSRRPNGSQELVVVDPSGAAWLGCGNRAHCRVLRPGSDENVQLLEALDGGLRQGDTTFHPRVARLGLPASVVVGGAPRLTTPLGVWSVAVMAPAAEIDVRQATFLWQLIITSIGVATAMLTIGLLILRQHKTAAGLAARVQAAEEVARLQRQLVRAEKLVTVGVLSAGIAHEIGTPLAVVRGRAEHMLERRLDVRDREDLQAIVGEIDRIVSTIRQVLDFSRDQPVTVRATDARAALARAIDLLEWRLAGQQVRVQVDVPADLPPLAAAADQLEQVLLNLLLNACDASRPDAVIEVTARREKRSDRVRIEVTDHGSGIPPHHLNAVFDPYFTTKKRGDGSGLGLAIVEQIVRAHRGEVALRSKLGVGTVAMILWPTALPVDDTLSETTSDAASPLSQRGREQVV